MKAFSQPYPLLCMNLHVLMCTFWCSVLFTLKQMIHKIFYAEFCILMFRKPRHHEEFYINSLH